MSAPVDTSQSVPDLIDVLMSETLAKMSVISEMGARNYEGNVIHGGERDYAPAPLSDRPLVDHFRRRYGNARSDWARREVLLAAIRELRVARRMHVPEGQPPTIDHPLWKQWVADSPLPGAEVARLFHVSRQYVHQIRVAYETRRPVK